MTSPWKQDQEPRPKLWDRLTEPLVQRVTERGEDVRERAVDLAKAMYVKDFDDAVWWAASYERHDHEWVMEQVREGVHPNRLTDTFAGAIKRVSFAWDEVIRAGFKIEKVLL